MYELVDKHLDSELKFVDNSECWLVVLIKEEVFENRGNEKGTLAWKRLKIINRQKLVLRQ